MLNCLFLFFSRNITSYVQTGDLHIAIYDHSANEMYLLHQFTLLGLTILFILFERFS